MPESELAKQGASSDPTKSTWSTVEILLASLIDEVRFGNWAYVQSWSEGNVPRPSPIRRPGLVRTGKVMSLTEAQKIDPRLRGMSSEDAQDFLDRMHSRGR
jgi:hypothetical protein